MKLLIADDEIQVRKGLAEAIDWSQCGINTVLTAANGVEALDICKIQRPEVVLTDIRMPGCDGLQLAKEIINLYALVRVIILSGYSEFKYAQQAVKIGVKDFLLKPIDIDELIQVVSECVHSVCEQRDNAIFHMRMAENASPFRGLSREVELVVDHITQHYAENISLGDMAAMVGKSRNYFSSLFKKTTGMTPREYRRAQKNPTGTE